MKVRILLFFTLITLIFPSAAWTLERELLDRVIAVVNDEPITQSELDVLLKPVYEQFREQYRGEELVAHLNDARRKLLNQLIEDRLVLQEAERRGVEPDPLEIEQMMDRFKTQFPDEATFEEVLQMEGMTTSSLRQRLRQQAMIQHLHHMEIRSKVVIAPGEVERFYEENRNEFVRDESIRVRSITIRKNYEARQKGLPDSEAHTKIQDIKRKILAGEDFSKLARQHSEDMQAEHGGLSDWIRRGMMIAVIDEVIFSLELGEISAIIETPMGYHLFRVEETRQGRKYSLEEVRDDIFSRLYQQKSEERFYDWMRELKRSAYISIR